MKEDPTKEQSEREYLENNKTFFLLLEYLNLRHPTVLSDFYEWSKTVSSVYDKLVDDFTEGK